MHCLYHFPQHYQFASRRIVFHQFHAWQRIVSMGLFAHVDLALSCCTFQFNSPIFFLTSLLFTSVCSSCFQLVGIHLVSLCSVDSRRFDAQSQSARLRHRRRVFGCILFWSMFLPSRCSLLGRLCAATRSLCVSLRPLRWRRVARARCADCIVFVCFCCAAHWSRLERWLCNVLRAQPRLARHRRRLVCRALAAARTRAHLRLQVARVDMCRLAPLRQCSTGICG
jgi:hypothetical protein